MPLLKIFLAVAVVLLVALASCLLVSTHSTHRTLAQIRDDLTRRKILLPISTIVPPPSTEALENGRQFIALIEEFKNLNKTFPAVSHGPCLIHITSPGKAAPAAREAAPIFSDSNEKSPISWSELRTQLDAGRSLLGQAQHRLTKPIALPYDHATIGAANSFGQITHLAAWLRTAAVQSLHDGNIPEAINLLASLQQVAALAGLAKSPVHCALKIGIWSFGCRDLFWEILQEPALTNDDLKRLHTIAVQEDFFTDVVRCQEVELARTPYMYAELKKTSHKEVTWSFTSTPSGLLGSGLAMQFRNIAWPLLWADGDLARTLERDGRHVESMRASLPAKNWKTFIAANPETSHPVSTLDQWRFPIASVFSEVYLGRSLARTAFKAETARQLILTAIALRQYQLAHGQYPDSLGKLVPKYLTALPQDYYGSQPLQYRPLDDGQYLLYSVGENGTDDHGDASSHMSPPGMGTGRDFLWPQAIDAYRTHKPQADMTDG